MVLPLVASWFVALGTPSPSHSLPSEGRATLSEAEEEANCRRVSQIVTAHSAPVLAALESLARQRYGRSFSELTPEQAMTLAMAARVEGRPMSAAQRRMEERCAAWQQRVMAKESAAGGQRSLFSAQALLDRWGRERLAGLGCDCPGFRPSAEDQEQRCATRPVCPGQQGGARVPDPERGCPAIGASAWIRQQLPEFYALLGLSPRKEEVRDVIAARDRMGTPSACGPLPEPNASWPGLASLSDPGAMAPVAIAAGAACFASPTAAACQEALVRGDALVASAHRAGRDRCLGYALTARTLWALGADPRFTDLLIRFPEATRLRNEARIALRYLRVDCRGL
ncbi:gluconate 2-dehydrogenase subunit 3 family protein [Cyanobium sp. AMD-g]|uniref:gluconate 2-dehydrogenase subunit 3 family protein n=1 Tax=Cyanobium sp. AMD-g TaxID=2823699 RepID=UPI0020CDD374|nr:gluconate 2-dehydrogenase subunit 3 family protein [Cyanobium sp. AMD-g]